MKTIHAALIAVLLAVPGCPSPAGPPAPPAELPSALRFPESVSIAVETTRPAGSALITEQGPFFDEITFGSGIVSFGNTVLEGILGPLSAFKIPVGEDVTTFSASLNEGGTLKTLKIDFAAYDFDGSTGTCSGHTAALPICYRVWVGDERRIAGVFEGEFPVAGRVGRGRFVAGQVDLGSGSAEFRRIRAVYDHIDPTDKSTEMFLPFDDSEDEGAGGPIPHTVARQEGADATALKTVTFTLGPLVNGLTQWREGEDFWLGTINEFVDVSPDLESVEDQCARISTQVGIDDGFCSGLSLGGLEFPSVGVAADLEFPAQFSESPPPDLIF